MGKCACLHIGHNNPSRSYKVNDVEIPETDEMIDLGVVFTEDLKPSAHCQRIVAKAHRMISTIKLAFKFSDPDTLSTLYKAFVRPILEYCCVIWCPYYIKDIEALERAQRRFSRLHPSLRDLTYEERLSNLHLETLHTRRLRFDLTTVYKIFHGLIDIDPGLIFDTCTDSRTRGHRFKLATAYSRVDSRKYFFSSRIVPSWNSLPPACVEASSVAIFKSELSKYLLSTGAR